MAQKRVNVRLAAFGGKQVKAELEGIGKAGERGFRKVSREADIANARLARFARRAKIAFATMAAAAVAGGVAMVRSGLQVIDEQAKLAQSLGTTTRSVQVLARAGELAGVSMSGIEQATKDLTRRLSQAAAGGGPAAAALERLGLSAEELLQIPLDERVGAINSAIEDFIPVAERAAIAGQLFGEEGSIAMSRIDSAAIRQATQDVKEFGVAVTASDVKQIERTNNAISRLGQIWRGMANQLAVAVAPSLEKVSFAIAELLKKSNAGGAAIRALGAAFKVTLEIATLLIDAIRVVGEVIGGFAAAIRRAVQPQTEFQTATANLVLAMGDEIRQSQQLDAALQRSGTMSKAMAETKLQEARARYQNVSAIIAEQIAAARASDDYASLLKRIDDQRTYLNTLGFPAIDAAPVRLKATFEEAQQELAALLNLQQEMLRAPQEMQDQLALVEQNIATLEDALANSTGGVVTFGDALIEPITLSEQLRTTITGAGNSADVAGDKARTSWSVAAESLSDYATRAMDVAVALGDTLTNAFNRGADAIADFVRTGKLDFASLVTSMLADMARLAAQRFIFGPLANLVSGVFSGLGGLFGTIFHDGGVVGAAAPQRLLPATVFAGAPRMHSGGWAGLRPDEVPAILQRGERVLSRREVAAGFGESAPVNITIVTRDAESFRQSRAQVAADLSRAVALGRRGM